MNSRCRFLTQARLILLVMVVTLSPPLLAQNAEQLEPGLVKLDASGEMELRSLIEYVAERAGIRFMYDQAVIGKNVNIIVPDPIPVSSLLDVLQSVLKTEELVIADAGVDGWKRIVPLTRIPEVARPLVTWLVSRVLRFWTVQHS